MAAWFCLFNYKLTIVYFSVSVKAPKDEDTEQAVDKEGWANFYQVKRLVVWIVAMCLAWIAYDVSTHFIRSLSV